MKTNTKVNESNEISWLWLGLGLGLGMLCLPAFADTTAVLVPVSADSEVWFGNVLKAVLAASAVPIAAILTQMLWMVAKKMGIEASEADMQKLNNEARAALTMGAVKAGELISRHGWDHVTVNNEILRNAMEYFLQRFPDRAEQIAKQAGVEAPAEASQEKSLAVKETLMARLPDAVSEASKSPATPPVTTVTTVRPGPPVEVITETQGVSQPAKL